MAEPKTKHTAPYNFCQATERDDLLYGAARPGAEQAICYDADKKMPHEEVLKWVDFMKQHDIKHVVSLLTPSELATFEPGFEELMKDNFKYGHIDVKAQGAFEQLKKLIAEGYNANEKVLVHCWGGGGRAGGALASWVADHYELPAEAAAEEVPAVAADHGCKRRVEVGDLSSFMAS